jgi:hypothetical protein
MGGMGKADDETIVGGNWFWSTFAQNSFVIQRYKDVVQTRERARRQLILEECASEIFPMLVFFV